MPTRMLSLANPKRPAAQTGRFRHSGELRLGDEDRNLTFRARLIIRVGRGARPNRSRDLPCSEAGAIKRRTPRIGLTSSGIGNFRTRKFRKRRFGAFSISADDTPPSTKFRSASFVNPTIHQKPSRQNQPLFFGSTPPFPPSNVLQIRRLAPPHAVCCRSPGHVRKYKWQCLNNRNLIHSGFCALEIETIQCTHERDKVEYF
jgi:hypothetical protein